MSVYMKPEVRIVGDAAHVIQGQKLAPPHIDAH
jgi:hypothetical protein